MDLKWLNLDLNISTLNDPPAKPGPADHELERPAVKQVKELEAELGRISDENKRLKEMLASMAANYSVLQGQLAELASKASDDDGSGDASSSDAKRKRLAVTDSSTSSEEEDSSRKLLKEDPCKPLLSKFYVRTDPSDSSLVIQILSQ